MFTVSHCRETLWVVGGTECGQGGAWNVESRDTFIVNPDPCLPDRFSAAHFHQMKTNIEKTVQRLRVLLADFQHKELEGGLIVRSSGNIIAK